MTTRLYNHVERLNSPDVEGILNGTITWSAKLDGTNAVLAWDSENNCIAAFSRTRRLYPTKDNAGFYVWANSDDEEAKILRNFCFMNPEYIVYGEWMGTSRFVGNIKDYNSEALGKMWVFDVYDTLHDEYLPESFWRHLLDNCFTQMRGYAAPFPWYVPFYTMENPTEEKLKEAADNNFFLLDNANHAGEGIVIRRADFRNKFGRYEIAKYVREEYKQNKSKPKKIAQSSGEIEKDICEYFVTDAECSKTIAKIELATGEPFSKTKKAHVGRYIATVWHDAILEEMPAICKKYKNPTINFSTLNSLCNEKARKYIGF